MSTWEERFATRINALHHASSSNFEDLVNAEIHPVFESVKPFVTSGGFSAELMQGCETIRHYRFSLSQDMFIDLYFTHKGPCEVSSKFQLHDPFSKQREAVIMETIPLSDVTEGWARQQFEVCLDEFLGEVEAMVGTGLPTVLDEKAETPSDKPQAKPQATNDPSAVPATNSDSESIPQAKPDIKEAPASPPPPAASSEATPTQATAPAPAPAAKVQTPADQTDGPAAKTAA